MREGITVSVKTNLGPSITLYKASSGSHEPEQPGLLDLLGLKASVTVTDSHMDE